ncbi:hypothetical protein BDR26DRAFT_1006403 [Obelidium mucronatum]|nr:hypothetical protein BDR26DRAFT_1006403 [Obelidium mucronatum]
MVRPTLCRFPTLSSTLPGVVFYKFKSAKDYDQAIFDGLGISVFDLKKEIMVKKKLGKGLDFDLVVSNAQTNDEYPDDNQVIPRNTSILVLRRPAAKHGRGTAARYVGGFGGAAAAAAPIQTATSGTAAAAPSLAFGVNTGGLFGGGGAAADRTPAAPVGELTEDEKMQAMFRSQDAQITRQQDEMLASRPAFAARGGGPGGFRGGGSFRGARGGGEAGASETWGGHAHYVNRPLPPGYVCFRCGKQGHHIAQCPTIGDVNYDRPKLKKTTGIPKMFLKEIDEAESGLGTEHGPEGGLMVSQTGKIVVATTNDDAWTKLSSTARAFGGVGDVHKMAPVLPEYKCSLCSKNMKNAVQAPCCETSFCDECIEEQLRDGSPQFQCPSCKKELFPDTLRPNTSLRSSIDKYLKSFVAASTAGKSPSLSDPTNNNTNNSRTQSPSLQQQQQQQQQQDTLKGGAEYARPNSRPYGGGGGAGAGDEAVGNGASAIPVVTSDRNNVGMMMMGGPGYNQMGRGGYNNYRGGGGYQNQMGGRGGYQYNYNNNMGYNNMYGGGGGGMGMMGNQMMNGNQMWNGNRMGGYGGGYGGGGGGGGGYNNMNGGGMMYNGGGIDSNGKRKREDDDEKPPENPFKSNRKFFVYIINTVSKKMASPYQSNPLDNFEPLSSTQLTQYLNRIHLPPTSPQPQPEPPTLALLNRIIHAHSSHIPFENGHLRFLDSKPRLNQDQVFERLVTDQRGGYCFQQNSLLLSALLALGYKAYPGAARPVVWNPDLKRHVLKGTTHMILFVDLLEDGNESQQQRRRFLVDVGYSRIGMIRAMAVTVGEEILSAGDEVVRLDSSTITTNSGGWMLSLKRPGWAPVQEGLDSDSDGFLPVLYFTMERYRPQDFEVFNHFVSTEPTQIFVTSFVASIVTATGGRANIVDRTFKRFEGAQHRELDRVVELPCLDDFVAVLKSEFGIELGHDEIEGVKRILYPVWNTIET